VVWRLAAPFGTTCALDGEVRVTLRLQPQAHIWGTKWPPEADRMADDPHLTQEVHRGLKSTLRVQRDLKFNARSVFPKLRKLADPGWPSILDNPDFRSKAGGNASAKPTFATF
jgi:hypothetical protein